MRADVILGKHQMPAPITQLSAKTLTTRGILVHREAVIPNAADHQSGITWLTAESMIDIIPRVIK